MPFYEYECKNCGDKTEVQQKINDNALEHCESCSENELRRIIHASPIHFKGKGFYVTDYKMKGNKKE